MRLRTDIDGTTSQHVVVIVSPGIKDYNHYQKTGEISLDWKRRVCLTPSGTRD